MTYEQVYKMVKQAHDITVDDLRKMKSQPNLTGKLKAMPKPALDSMRKALLPGLQGFSKLTHPAYRSVLGYGNYDLPARLRFSDASGEVAGWLKDPDSIPTVVTGLRAGGGSLTPMDKIRLRSAVARQLVK